MSNYIRVPYKKKYDTVSKSWILYNNEFAISGYGKTIREAKSMFKYCVNDLLTLKPHKR